MFLPARVLRMGRAMLAALLAIGLLLTAAHADAPANPMLGGAPVPVATEAPAEGSVPEAVENEQAEEMDEKQAEIDDDEAQDWYEELYAEAQAYVPQPGTMINGALLAKGQPTLGKVEIEVLLALEEAQAGTADVISSEGKINILLLGVDARPKQSTGRSDAMILCSVDVRSGTIKMVSFMRDMYVSIPKHNPNRLNVAYYWGGPDLLYETLTKNFGVTVEHYVAVDYSVLSNLIDQLGGLEIEVEDAYFVERINAVIENDNKALGLPENDGLVKSPGLQTLTGKQAQAYARFRYGAKSGGDYARTGRQREVLMKIFEKVTQLSLAEIVQFAMANIDEVDTDMTLADLVKLAPIALQLKDAKFEEMRVPADGYFRNEMINGMDVILPNYKAITSELRAFLTE